MTLLFLQYQPNSQRFHSTNKLEERSTMPKRASWLKLKNQNNFQTLDSQKKLSLFPRQNTPLHSHENISNPITSSSLRCFTSFMIASIKKWRYQFFYNLFLLIHKTNIRKSFTGCNAKKVWCYFLSIPQATKWFKTPIISIQLASLSDH